MPQDRYATNQNRPARGIHAAFRPLPGGNSGELGILERVLPARRTVLESRYSTQK
jgi:hypothetical protein